MLPEGTAPYRRLIVAWRKSLREERRRERLAEAKRLVHAAAVEFPFRRMYLFGSTAGRGSLSPWSDLDLAVEGLPEELFLKLSGHLCDRAGIPIDLKPLESLPPGIRTTIVERGLLLYER